MNDDALRAARANDHRRTRAAATQRLTGETAEQAKKAAAQREFEAAVQTFIERERRAGYPGTTVVVTSWKKQSRFRRWLSDGNVPPPESESEEAGWFLLRWEGQLMSTGSGPERYSGGGSIHLLISGSLLDTSRGGPPEGMREFFDRRYQRGYAGDRLSEVVGKLRGLSPS